MKKQVLGVRVSEITLDKIQQLCYLEEEKEKNIKSQL